jgi:hypothetical protein
MKRKTMLCLSLAVAAFAVVVTSSRINVLSQSKVKAPNNNDEISESVIQRGFEIVPEGLQLNLRGKNRALVGLGSYNVNAQGGCNDCHTNPPYAAGGDPFAGEPEQINIPCYLSGGTSFGPFTSRNLTPDSNGLPAGLTLDEFIHVLRTGEDTTSPFNPPFDGGLLQVMPWPVYGKMTDRDLKAIYEYLSAIPSRPRCSTPPA